MTNQPNKPKSAAEEAKRMKDNELAGDKYIFEAIFSLRDNLKSIDEL